MNIAHVLAGACGRVRVGRSAGQRRVFFLVCVVDCVVGGRKLER